MEIKEEENEKKEKFSLKLSSDVPENYDTLYEGEEHTDTLIRTSAVSTTIDLTNYRPTGPKPQGLVLTISMVLVYIGMVAQLGSIAYVCTQETVDMVFNLLSYQGLYSAITVLILVDSILVNVLYKRKISLVLVAWLLPFLYPLKRSKHIGNNDLPGSILCACFVLAMLGTVLMAGKAVAEYGVAIQIEDETVRHEVAAAMDQTLEGQRIGARVQKTINMNAAEYVQKNGVDYIVMYGYGSVYVNVAENAFIDEVAHNTKTCLVFSKKGTNPYALTGVTLGDKVLSSGWVASYYQQVMK